MEVIRNTAESVEASFRYDVADQLLDQYNLGRITLAEVVTLYTEQFSA